MISILMPVYNAENYLEETLESIIGQTREEWELIAVNDHSTDQSKAILEKFSDEDERIKVYDNHGEGIVDALSFAYEKSTYNFINRMDADDIMMKTKLSRMATELINNPGTIVTSYVKYFSEKELGEGFRNYESWLNALIDNNNHYDHIYKECVVPSPNWMMERSTLNLLGGFESLQYPEDYDLVFKAYQNKIRIIGLKEVLHHWRDYPERTSRNHEHYKDNAFLDLKVEYFLKIDRNHSDLLILWGAGKKGKYIAKLLAQNNVDFHWITDNPKKVGIAINEVQLESTDVINELGNLQAIIAVAGPDDQKGIQNTIAKNEELKAFWFC